jgi:CBS domain-containing protein
MRSELQVLRTTESAADAACLLAVRGDEAIPLCLSDGSLAGTVSNRDIVAKVVAKGRDPRQVLLAELAEPDDVLGLDVDVPVDEAISVMCRSHRTRLPVVQRDRVVGVVTQGDIARSLAFRPAWDEA